MKITLPVIKSTRAGLGNAGACIVRRSRQEGVGREAIFEQGHERMKRMGYLEGGTWHSRGT
jgi:hypothetical protein